MTRSQDPRRKLPSQRGAKRTGPIGTILPGDHTEVARDIQRIWWEIHRMRQRPLPAAGNVGVPIDSAYKISGAGLQYWYRLGEAGPYPSGATTTLNFAKDSSGNARHLTAHNSDNLGAILITSPTDTALPLCDVTGALTGGNVNDGGIRFNRNDFEWTSWGGKVALICPTTTHIETVGSTVGSGSTFACWLAFQPPASTGTDSFAPGDSTMKRPLVSTFAHSFGISSYGVIIAFRPSDGVLFYTTYASPTPSYTWQSDFSFVANQWYHFAASIEKLSTTLLRRRIYINSNRILDVTGDATAMGPAAAGATLSLGGGWDDDLRWGSGRGKLDEVAMWTSVLTQSQITDLWNARVLNEGETWGNSPTLSNILIEKGDLVTRNDTEVSRIAAGTNDFVLTADSAAALGIKWAKGYHPPATLPVLPHTPTAQDIADALVALGLATQL